MLIFSKMVLQQSYPFLLGLGKSLKPRPFMHLMDSPSQFDSHSLPDHRLRQFCVNEIQQSTKEFDPGLRSRRVAEKLSCDLPHFTYKDRM